MGGMLVPVKWKWIAENGAMLGRANAYAAGVFLALALVHLLPEASEGLSGEGRYAALFTMLGYFLILCVETIARGDNPPPTLLDDSMHDMSSDPPSDEEVGRAGCDRPRPQRRHQPNESLTAYILMAALSTHSVVEGLSIGIEKDVRGASLLAVSVSVHKFIAAVALGSNLSAEGVTQHIVGMALIFAASTPLGIGLGWAANGILPVAADAVIQALSAGTFLYIGASELVPKEFTPVAGGLAPKHKIPFLCLGVTSIYLLTVLLDFD
eukprot:TRINITY_DN15818_c0_g1_i6.p1 TRINITY_DN15818_c0_g1~~TRINITY_DN15818_c0_g1_i6.p1  ORF type:complete len:303 (+),score=97.65 TRINITY_DN15818_c0_g1_i6:109-909(+)